MIERFAAFATLLITFFVAGIQMTNEYSWVIWCAFPIALLLEGMAYRKGVVEGMLMYKNCDSSIRKQLDQHLKEIEK